ncbi:MAG: 4-hydroxy-tetrahydrodipicolinate synthase [Coriobacteriales bacterium]|nr:4-hydroxy-tetrahydrodipicolinate synthase [Coriobacteriales bacterium]
MAQDVRKLTGSIVALVTPFKDNGEIDFAALDRLVDFHLENHTDGILVLGTTGESSTMTDAEDVAVAQHVVNRVNGQIPIIGGAGSNSTQESLLKAKGLQMVGCDALLLITPYYNKSNEEGIYRHFTTVLDVAEIPSILYNIPGRTGCSISEANVIRLAEHPNVMGIKEASGSISYATSVARHLSPDFRMYSGNDDMIVPILSLGGSGVISVWANVQPQLCHDLVASYLDGDYKSSLAMQLLGLDLVHALFCEVNPIPVKAALNMMGMIEETYRAPLYHMTAANRSRLEQAMKGAGLID